MTDNKCPRLLSASRNLKTFIWNGETNTFLGRTAVSWAKIVLYYVVFYAVLASFCACLFAVFWQTIDLEQPKWQLRESLIGTNPGIGFCPMPPKAISDSADSALIWTQPENIAYWYDTVNKFLEGYINPKNYGNVDKSCSFDRPASKGKFCPFKVESLDNCSPGKTDQKYGYPHKKPCVFLKLNKIFNWTPRVFNETSIDQLTDAEERATYRRMPEWLRNEIAITSDAHKRNMIWVSCEGERPLDVENIGPVQYSPGHGFPAYYFPFKNVKGYKPPIVAVKFDQPKLGVLISIECTVWAKNIFYDVKKAGGGSVHFKLMID
ncbi:sodium/potassium-transporting ATPase subunit beta-2-like [Bradysia coprophila]|uniref:sodium/potassium-transporting ATPase subunit beta-2-like n=1 Tax=Bradysia coprophila TaxID=38358 RepID=UPI00187D80D8|nr:sodium/potassium-transporting ATPase subunit beta-2-like [Bradysia coprophila]